jgi:hypothetical protein
MLHQESEADPVVMLKRSAKSRVVGPDASSTFALALTHTPGGLASPLPLLFACTVVNVHALALPPVRSRSNVCTYVQAAARRTPNLAALSYIDGQSTDHTRPKSHRTNDSIQYCGCDPTISQALTEDG